MTIGQRIQKRREELGLTQEELAHKIGYKSKSSINKIELDVQQLRQGKIKAIAEALQTTPSYIMGWEEEKRVIRAELSSEEDLILRAYRAADEGIRDAVAKLLDVQRKKEDATGSSVASGM